MIIKSNADLCHTFSNKLKDRGKYGNLFFEHNKLYSYGYHYLLAKFVKDNVILINDSGYSVTTSKHITLIRQASRQYTQLFTTETDGELVEKRLNQLYNKLVKATKPLLYINEIVYLVDKYAQNCKLLDRTPLTVILEYKDKLSEQQLKDAKIQAKKDEISKKEKESQEFEVNKAKFLNYETDYITGKLDLIRLTEDKRLIETSQKVLITLEVAKDLYQAIVNNINIVGYKIGNYQVKQLTKDSIVIGCHTIPLTNIHEVGKQLI